MKCQRLLSTDFTWLFGRIDIFLLCSFSLFDIFSLSSCFISFLRVSCFCFPLSPITMLKSVNPVAGAVIDRAPYSV